MNAGAFSNKPLQWLEPPTNRPYGAALGVQRPDDCLAYSRAATCHHGRFASQSSPT
jgi:hypothetical protein